MARELVTEFGRPDDGAARYRPAGLAIIPPEQSGVFLTAAMNPLISNSPFPQNRLADGS